jgi:dihydrofolate reductase
MEAPGGEAGYPHAGWVTPLFSDELGAYKEQEQLGAGVLVLGRKTYESFVGAWPKRDGVMAEKINTMPKLVASTTLGSSDWNDTTVVASDLGGAIGALKQQDGDPILVAGGRSVVHALLDAGLVDQINLQVFPLLLGSGIGVFARRGEPIRLELISSRALSTGVTLDGYALVR